MSRNKRYCSIIIENRLNNALYDTILDHRYYLPSHWSNCHIADQTINTGADYNRLLTSKKFWEQFNKFDRVLIYQHDSKILRFGIEEFLKWDFIGAPLYHIDYPAMNGGFSLRNPKAMLKIIESDPWDSTKGNEDIYFATRVKKVPPKEIAQLFSVETIFGLGSLGVHAIDKWHSPEKVQEILNQYGDLKQHKAVDLSKIEE